ncbi:hypothetical protein [Aeribacillus pallidus]|uniref:hypothetical protein n=1 Tax=Aeribacillus pallidus TaxID=33936 RepID=UPI003D19A945
MVQLWRAFGDLVPLFLIVVLFVGLISYFVLRKRIVDSKKVVVNILLVFTIIGILLVTVFPNFHVIEMPRVLL